MEDFDGDNAPFSTAAELLWFMENVPGLRCGFDTGNFLYSEEDAAAVLPDFLPYIAAVHCKDRGWAKNAGDPKITVGGRAMYPVAVGDGISTSPAWSRRFWRRATPACLPPSISARQTSCATWSARRST